MATRFYQLIVDAHDPARLGRWWSEVLGYDLLYGVASTANNRCHIDLDPADHEAEVARVIGLGARRSNVGPGDARWTVLADPEGNEFCVLRRTST